MMEFAELAQGFIEKLKLNITLLNITDMDYYLAQEVRYFLIGKLIILIDRIKVNAKKKGFSLNGKLKSIKVRVFNGLQRSYKES